MDDKRTSIVPGGDSLGLPQHRLVLLALTASLLFGFLSVAPATAQWDRDLVRRALNATVLILVPDDNGDLYDSGSGTILDGDRGLILTNFHVIGEPETGELFNGDGTAIIGVMAPDLRGAPVLRYVARLVDGSPEDDLAVLRIQSLFDDPNAALPANLGLIAIERGDSDDLLPGDALAVIGYPGLGGSTVTFTEGVVSGFLDENLDGVYEWIKTDAEVNPGNSGGLAIDHDGRFIGVPSAGYSRADVAGKISLIRPGAVALPIFDGIALGDRITRDNLGMLRGDVGDTQITVGNAQFGDSIDRRSRVIDPIARFPSGAKDIYMSYDYSGFGNGATFTYIWYLDGEEIYRDAFVWQADANGTDWLNLHSERGLPDGLYAVELLLDKELIFRNSVLVGEGSDVATGGAFSPITFASDVTAGDKPANAGNTFVEVKEVYAFFNGEDVAPGTPWTTRWLFNGEEVLKKDQRWEGDRNAATWVSLTHPEGLPTGGYSLELYVAGQLSRRGDFSVVGGRTARNTEVNVAGTVSDRDNSQRKIAGALIVLLTPGTSIDEWSKADFDEEMIHATGTSIGSGSFRLDAKVLPGERYAVVAIHDDYRPLEIEGFLIPADTGDPYALNLEMERQ